MQSAPKIQTCKIAMMQSLWAWRVGFKHFALGGSYSTILGLEARIRSSLGLNALIQSFCARRLGALTQSFPQFSIRISLNHRIILRLEARICTSSDLIISGLEAWAQSFGTWRLRLNPFRLGGPDSIIFGLKSENVTNKAISIHNAVIIKSST